MFAWFKQMVPVKMGRSSMIKNIEYEAVQLTTAMGGLNKERRALKAEREHLHEVLDDVLKAVDRKSRI